MMLLNLKDKFDTTVIASDFVHHNLKNEISATLS